MLQTYLTILNLTGVDRHDYFKKIKNYDIILTSYALVRRDIELYRKFDFKQVGLRKKYYKEQDALLFTKKI